MTNEATKIVQKLGVPDGIAQLTINIFGDTDKAERWLNTPIHALNDSKPIERLKTDADIEEVKLILRKIEGGEFP